MTMIHFIAILKFYYFTNINILVAASDTSSAFVSQIRYVHTDKAKEESSEQKE